MRSELVTQAVVPVSNRFLLVHVASILTRKFHRRGKDRVQESINSSLAGIGQRRYSVSVGCVIVDITHHTYTPVPAWVFDAQTRPEERHALILASFPTLQETA